jgi:hypothetical protein
MKEFGTLLTTTGVVATLFAVFFAATAMYIQYRKNNQIKKIKPQPVETHHGSSPGSLISFEQQPHVEVSDGGHIVEEDTPAVVTKDKFVPPTKDPLKSVTKNSVPSQAIFKKYMPSGVASATLDDSSEYIWE